MKNTHLLLRDAIGFYGACAYHYHSHLDQGHVDTTWENDLAIKRKQMDDAMENCMNIIEEKYCVKY